ncbi:MAG: hypothetical protein WCR52_13620 [Bacteroidota bacterium]
METFPPDQQYEFLPPEDLMQRIAALEKAFAAAEHKAQKYVRENELLATQKQELQKELHKIQGDYESLRLQKGGFGFKTILATGFVGTVVGIVVCYVLFKPKDQHVAAFERFRHETQFNIEYAISEGQFIQAEEVLKVSLEKPENELVKPEIQMMYKIVSAAKRKCQ